MKNLMRLVPILLLAAAMFFGAVAAATPAAAQDDETGYSIDGEDGDSDAGYSASGDSDTQVLGTTLSRTGANTTLLVLIGGATIFIGIGLDRWSTRLEPES